MHSVPKVLIAITLSMIATAAFAGAWRGLPDAVARLRNDPDDRSARSVLGEAEASVVNEAKNGRLAAVVVLMETYVSLVAQLDDGDGLVRRLEERVGAALIDWGDGRREADAIAAATAWTVAARYDGAGTAAARLRELALPPPDPRDGQTWRSVLDGAELVYQPPLRVRIGCSEFDRRCRENEVYFRWVDVPGFWIEATEVTNERYRRCVDAGLCSPPSDVSGFGNSGRAKHPVVSLTWHQARDYARWMGRRLPSEAEWERAARGKDTRWRFPWGNSRHAEWANVWDETVAAGRGLLPIATFPKTGWGLYDMSGNAWEWCEDRYQAGFKELPANGAAVRSGVGRVVRGGSWRRDIDMARVSARSWFDETYSADDLGFRCAMDRSSEVSDAQVISAAERAFALRSTPGGELVGVELSTEDRFYLERRAVTWLMLERRTEEAVSQAEHLLRRDPSDPVALELLDWIEGEILEDARTGDVNSVVELRSRYLRAVSTSSRFDRRLRGTEGRLVEALLACGETRARDGDRERAADCFDLGLKIDPTNLALRRRRESMVLVAGDTRIWPADGRVMVWVPSGTFQFGASPGDRQAAIDEFPSGAKKVDGFWLDQREVTNDDYRRCVDAGACTPPSRTDVYDDPNRGTHPVLWVSWFQAREYAMWAGKRLPSEVEWECAARAGGHTRFPWGETWVPGHGNVFETDEIDRWAADSPVGGFPGNMWGIQDLIGNAAEWVQDVYHTSLSGGPMDGRPWEQETGPIAERRRVIRGGSYIDPPSRQRVSHRSARKPTDDHRTTGFRCAAD